MIDTGLASPFLRFPFDWPGVKHPSWRRFECVDERFWDRATPGAKRVVQRHHHQPVRPGLGLRPGCVDHLVRKGSARFLRPQVRTTLFNCHIGSQWCCSCPITSRDQHISVALQPCMNVERLCPSFLSESPVGVTLEVKKNYLRLLLKMCADLPALPFQGCTLPLHLRSSCSASRIRFHVRPPRQTSVLLSRDLYIKPLLDQPTIKATWW